jgi:aminoglycoside 6-adenylyltransferase
LQHFQKIISHAEFDSCKFLTHTDKLGKILETILNRILAWAKAESSVKALILLGSYAARMADEYSDLDLAVFCTTFDPYVTDEKWLSNIAQVWVCVYEKVEYRSKTFPTRLVIFEKGVKIDFSFYTLDVLHDLVRSKSLPDDYNRGYSVLIDKESLTASMPKAVYKEQQAHRPSQEEFLRITNEFWFEVHHVAKYLKRNDLWSVKFRSGSIYDNFLLKMIEWNEEAKRNWASQVPPLGKRMQSWVDAETWHALHKAFAHFDSRDSGQALSHMIELFRKLAVDTANRLEYSYPYDLDKNMSQFAGTILSSL